MSENRQVAYTHWAYFDDLASAQACGHELDARFDCLTVIDRSADDTDWLLRAARTVNAGTNWHDEIEEVVERHGGEYDFGEACMFVPPTVGPQER